MAHPQYPGDKGPHPQAVGPAPGRANARIAGWLALIGSVVQLPGGVASIGLGIRGHRSPDLTGHETSLIEQSWYSTYAVATGVSGTIAGILLATGAVMLFKRKPAGRPLVVAGCALVALAWIVRGGIVLSISDSASEMLGGGIGNLIFPIVTAALALAPTTTRSGPRLDDRASLKDRTSPRRGGES